MPENLFNSADLIDLLLDAKPAQAGRYNQLQWTVTTGVDATDDLSKVISMHEFMHNDLNNISIYGSLLQAYAYLAKEDFPERTKYEQTLISLVEKCREAHEVYATYMGIMLFIRLLGDDLPDRILKMHPVYTAYYRKGENLVKEFNSIYLKQQVFSVVIRICFQSEQLGLKAKNNLRNFNVAEVPEREYPDKRLDYIINGLEKDFLRDCVEDFIRQYDDKDGQMLLLTALEGRGDDSVLFATENNKYAEDMASFLYSKLDAFFRKNKSKSFSPDKHLEYFASLLPLLNDIFPSAQAKNPLTLNRNPYDYDRNVLQSFENETWLFYNRPLPCIVLLPGELTQEEKKVLYKGTGAPPHIFITGNDSRFISMQYDFIHPEYEKRFNAINGAFTAMRFADVTDGKRTIVYVLFESPEELLSFLEEKAASVMLLCSISVSATYQTEWWNRWIDFFIEKCDTACLILDVSPLYYIENIFPSFDKIFYEKIIIKGPERTQTAMIFDGVKNDKTEAVLILPCSDMYCLSIAHFINTRYPEKYTFGITVSKEQHNLLPVILTHTFRENQLFYFYSIQDRS